MTKKKIYFPCKIDNFKIPEIFKELLTIQCQKLLLTINEKKDIEAVKYYMTISDLHQFCRLYFNSNHKVPLPQNNHRYWRIRGEITKYIYLLLLNIHAVESVNWTPANELIAILEERFIFYEYCSTVTESIVVNRSLIQKLRDCYNPYSELLPHSYKFIDLCIKYVDMADKAYIKKDVWIPFLESKSRLLFLLKSNYFPINEGFVKKERIKFSNKDLIFDKTCTQFCNNIEHIAVIANSLSKYTQGG